MLTHYFPGLIMFMITLAFVSLTFVPVTVFKQKNELVRFYWVGAWVFIAMIAAFAGAAETLALMNYDAGNIPIVMLTALTVCFVLFVVFGWFRLSYAALRAAVTFWVKSRQKNHQGA